MSTLRHLISAVKFEHTIFALPFAYLGMVLAARGLPALNQFIWITLAMVGARTLAMLMNRLIDAKIDAQNPRTAQRHLPQGILTKGQVILYSLFALLLFEFSAWQLNPLCFKLSPIALAFLLLYSYSKRFTWASHFILGFTDGLAPAGAWIAVTGKVAAECWLLAAIVTAWIAGFDIIYACQDVDFDRKAGLHSLPARFGIAPGLWAARGLHTLTAVLLLALGAMLSLGWAYWIGWLSICLLLIYEHRLVKPHDLSQLNLAFFNINGYIAVIVFVSAFAGLYF
jgi:4-hydroxybenzoate polyprenyltransferase